jgi:hypothetical protein
VTLPAERAKEAWGTIVQPFDADGNPLPTALEARDGTTAPPNYRPADDLKESCGTCAWFNASKHECEMYNVSAEADHTCDKWSETRSARDPAIEERKGKGKKLKVITFDYDETITKAPKQLRRVAKAMKKAGFEIWVVTGNEAKRDELEEWLKDLKFPYDGLVQYEDDETDGLQRENILKELNAWLAFDDRAGRAPTLTKACPHLFLAAKATKDNLKAEEDAKSAKKIVKQAKNES